MAGRQRGPTHPTRTGSSWGFDSAIPRRRKLGGLLTVANTASVAFEDIHVLVERGGQVVEQSVCVEQLVRIDVTSKRLKEAFLVGAVAQPTANVPQVVEEMRRASSDLLEPCFDESRLGTSVEEPPLRWRCRCAPISIRRLPQFAR